MPVNAIQPPAVRASRKSGKVAHDSGCASSAFRTPVDRFGDPFISAEPAYPAGVEPVNGHVCAAKPRSGRDRMQATLNQIGDPAKRDQMRFLLGYLCALMASYEMAPVPPPNPSQS